MLIKIKNIINRIRRIKKKKDSYNQIEVYNISEYPTNIVYIFGLIQVPFFIIVSVAQQVYSLEYGLIDPDFTPNVCVRLIAHNGWFEAQTKVALSPTLIEGSPSVTKEMLFKEPLYLQAIKTKDPNVRQYLKNFAYFKLAFDSPPEMIDHITFFKSDVYVMVMDTYEEQGLNFIGSKIKNMPPQVVDKWANYKLLKAEELELYKNSAGEIDYELLAEHTEIIYLPIGVPVQFITESVDSTQPHCFFLNRDSDEEKVLHMDSFKVAKFLVKAREPFELIGTCVEYDIDTLEETYYRPVLFQFVDHETFVKTLFPEIFS